MQVSVAGTVRPADSGWVKLVLRGGVPRSSSNSSGSWILPMGYGLLTLDLKYSILFVVTS